MNERWKLLAAIDPADRDDARGPVSGEFESL